MTPKHVPEALGKYVFIKAYVDANHAVNMENRRSHYCIIIYVNNAPIIRYSKIQKKVEDSSFRLNFAALVSVQRRLRPCGTSESILEYRQMVPQRYFVTSNQFSRIRVEPNHLKTRDIMISITTG